jgi:opacity protein-like surface antigen
MRLVTQTFAALLCFAMPLSAQTRDRGYVQALGGVATTSATDQFFAGSAALRAGRKFDGFVEIGRLRNGIWRALDDELAASGIAIRSEVATLFGEGATVAFDARVPVVYGMAGARLRGPRLGPFASYVEAGAGLARLRPEVHLDIDGESLDGDAARLLTLDAERTELLSAAGAGISLGLLRSLRLEAGYRYSRIHGDFAFNVNRIHAAVGFAF